MMERNPNYESYEEQLNETELILLELLGEVRDDWTGAGIRIKIEAKLQEIAESKARLTGEWT